MTKYKYNPNVNGRTNGNNANVNNPNNASNNPDAPTDRQVTYLIILGIPKAVAEGMDRETARREIDRLRSQPSRAQIRYAEALGANAREIREAKTRDGISALIQQLRLRRNGFNGLDGDDGRPF